MCDIDGTLVVKYQGVSDYTRKIINIISSHGIYFALATGRPYVQSKNIIAGYDLPIDFSINSNGCELYDYHTGILKQSDFMKAEWIKETIAIMKKFDAHPKLVTTGGVQISDVFDEYAYKSSKNGNLSMKIAESEEDFYVDCPKIMFEVKEEQMPEIEEYVSSLNLKNYYGFKTQPFLLEFVNKKVSKAVALKKYCKELNIDLKDVMAFGDMSNDIQMLEVAGVGVCLKNGSDDTKKISDYITEYPVEEDGLARFIEKEIIIPNNWN